MLAAGVTDKGRVRTQNQDAILCSPSPVGVLPNLFIVADGMGGHNAGDIASKKAVEVFLRYVTEFKGEAAGFLDLMADAAGEANQAVYEMSLSSEAYSGMGTTFSACVVANGKCEIIHIGDSRIYMITKDTITQLTTDHSFVNEMVRAGKLTPQQAEKHPKRNILTRVMGTSSMKEFDGCPCAVENGCAVLLCSDGLTNMLGDNEIFEIVNRGSPVNERAEELVTEANSRGGTDNISVILINIIDL